MMNKKAISTILISVLILLMTTTYFAYHENWFSSFASEVEKQQYDRTKIITYDFEILGIYDATTNYKIYIKNNQDINAQIEAIRISNQTCSLLSSGVLNALSINEVTISCPQEIGVVEDAFIKTDKFIIQERVELLS